MKLKFNNFDLIRLFCALQVATTHTASNFFLDSPIFNQLLIFLGYFPGVPIFFFISGYLIYQSYENIKNIKLFFKNRVLRIYPALYFCFFLTLLSLFLTGYLQSQKISISDFLFWIFTSLTFFQFFNPDFLRQYGLGVINGSLWTITVELQFYILTPVIFYGFKYYKKMTALFMILLIILNLVNSIFNTRSNIPLKLFDVSFIPWFYMFVFGAYVSSCSLIRTIILSINSIIYLILFIFLYYLSMKLNLGIGNRINPICYLILCCFVLKIAYTKPDLSYKILNGNDISYGIYIFHAPIINLFLFIDITNSTQSYILVIICTIALGIFSWIFIEKPFLNLKK